MKTLLALLAFLWLTPAFGQQATTCPTRPSSDNSNACATTAFTHNYVDEAWIPFTPVIGCVSGTLTSASATGRYKKFGKTYFVEFDISIVNNGTCAVAVNANLPNGIVSTARFSFAGREMNITGKMLGGVITLGSNTLSFVNYDNTYPGGNGFGLAISGIVEAQ